MKTHRLLALWLACGLAVSCASNAKDGAEPVSPADRPAKAGKLPPLNANEIYRPEPEQGKSEKSKPAKNKNTRVTIDPALTTLGDVVRSAGEQAGGNLVLMNGVENRFVDNLEIKRRTMRDSVAMIAAAGGLAIQDHRDYFFLFPSGYEQLVDLSLAGRLDARYNEIKTDAAFGSNLPLCSVFEWMSYALKVSIVADNSIGDARCGELALKDVPLGAALEAILKSARVPAVQVDSSPDFIFLSTPANTNPTSALLDEASLDERQKALLERRVTVALPRPLRTGQRMELPLHPSHLGDVLSALSEQVGARVVAEKGLERFPVNPFVIQNVPVRTALDLLIRQWLEPNYGYQVLSDRIVIRTR